MILGFHPEFAKPDYSKMADSEPQHLNSSFTNMSIRVRKGAPTSGGLVNGTDRRLPAIGPTQEAAIGIFALAWAIPSSRTQANSNWPGFERTAKSQHHCSKLPRYPPSSPER
jgi:hypothetical protein